MGRECFIRKKIMIIRVINQLRDDSFPGKIISKGQVATGGHFVDKAPGAQNILLPLDVEVLIGVELHYPLSTYGSTALGELRDSLSHCLNARKFRDLLLSPRYINNPSSRASSLSHPSQPQPREAVQDLSLLSTLLSFPWAHGDVSTLGRWEGTNLWLLWSVQR